MVSFLGIGVLGMFLAQATAPPDIAGRWSGEGWGQVVLTEIAPGEYAGRYTETVGKEPGKIELKWSRIERRFNGTWSEGENRFGDLSIRLADREIRGALTTDPKSKINPATPRLADLLWTRVESQGGAKPPAANVSPTVTVIHPTVRAWWTDYLDFTGNVEAGSPMRLVFGVDERTFSAAPPCGDQGGRRQGTQARLGGQHAGLLRSVRRTRLSAPRPDPVRGRPLRPGHRHGSVGGGDPQERHRRRSGDVRPRAAGHGAPRTRRC